MKYRYSFFIFLIAFILQTTVMNHFGIFQMSPNLILCLVVAYSFLYQGYHGIIYGILFGLIVDVCCAEIIGIAALSNFVVALICIELKRYLVYKMFGNSYGFLYVMKKEAVLLVYHMIVTLVIYRMVSRRVITHHGDRYMYRGSLQEARSLNRK